MKDFRMVVGFGAAVAAAVATTSGCSKAAAQRDARPVDRVIDLTVYKQDFAMVSEKRPVNLDGGHTRIAIDDVSKQLDPNSVLFDWQDAKVHPDVIATTYNLGVGNGSSLLSRLNGQQVDMMWPSDDGKPGEVISGRLEAAEQGDSFALRTKDKLYVNPGGTIVASGNTASTLPQLSVELDNRAAGKTQLGLSYLTRGMSWSADYVAKLDPDADKADLECWATIKNTTGVAFPAAKLTLMAGSPNREVQDADVAAPPAVNAPISGEYRDRNAVGFASRAKAPAMVSIGELHAYKIPSTATIGQDQMNRVSVFGTKTVPIRRDFAIRIPTLGAWGFGYDADDATKPHVAATLSIAFVNDEDSNLGIPLPSGSVRVYEKDDEGEERYTGAASIADTPKKEHVNLTLTNVFDVYAEYKVLKSTRLDKHIVRKTVETTIHNEKKASVTVRLVQSYDSRWTPVVESDKSEKIDSMSVQWKLPLKAGEERKLTYTVDIRG